MPPKAVRAIGTALIGPIRWAQRTGYSRSALAGKSVDARGVPRPWYCMAAVDFIDTLDFSGHTVLEFGSGQSTLWWAQKAESVTAVEESAEWFGYVQRSLQNMPKATVHLETDLNRYAALPRTWRRKFDVVIVDGGDRVQCMRTALDVIDDNGLVILDNSEGRWSNKPDEWPMIDMLEADGWMRIDFYGYAAGVLSTSVTSLCFKNGDRFRHLPPPRRGGK